MRRNRGRAFVHGRLDRRCSRSAVDHEPDLPVSRRSPWPFDPSDRRGWTEDPVHAAFDGFELCCVSLVDLALRQRSESTATA
jgi:hypothetical protein